MLFRKILKVCIVTFFIASCSTMGGGHTPGLDAARNASFPDRVFLEKLRSGYLAMSDYEWTHGSKEAARRYGQKAMATVNGIEPEMDPLYNRDIELSKMSELLGAKYFLEAAVIKGIKQQIPDQAASGQILFDCWVEQTENPVKKGRNCKAEFETVRKLIASGLDEMKQKSEASAYSRNVGANLAVPADLEEENVMPVEIERPRIKVYDKLAERKRELTSKMPDPSIIFFKYNSTELGITGKNILPKVARDIEIFKPNKVVITGNTDKIGSYGYNMQLAMRRAQVVADYMTENLGVNPSLLDTKAYGKNNPRVNPELIARDVRNRYVAIIFLNEDKTYYLDEDQQ